jgi:DNA modification methylase
MWYENVFKNKNDLTSLKYEIIDNVLLINGDCKEIIDLLKNDSVDVLFTDPPFNIGSNSKFSKSKDKFLPTKEIWGNKYQDYWDSQEDYWSWLMQIFSKLILKVKYHYIVYLDRAYIGHFNYLLKDSLDLKNMFCFVKNNPVPHFRKNNFRSTFELASWFSKNYRKINFTTDQEMKNVFKGNIGNKEIEHPNYKYDWMVVPIAKTIINDNDIVLDCFSGSGAIIYHSLKIRPNSFYIGIEKNKEFFQTSVNFFKEKFKQQVLIK